MLKEGDDQAATKLFLKLKKSSESLTSEDFIIYSKKGKLNNINPSNALINNKMTRASTE